MEDTRHVHINVCENQNVIVNEDPGSSQLMNNEGNQFVPQGHYEFVIEGNYLVNRYVIQENPQRIDQDNNQFVNLDDQRPINVEGYNHQVLTQRNHVPVHGNLQVVPEENLSAMSEEDFDEFEDISDLSLESIDNSMHSYALTIDDSESVDNTRNSHASKNEPKPSDPPLMPEVNLDDFEEVADLPLEPIDNSMNSHDSSKVLRPLERSGYISRTPRRLASSVDAENPYQVLTSLNQRLAASPYHCREAWWESLVNDFFYDDACMEFYIPIHGQVKKYNLDRAYIPAFFRSLYPTRKTSVSFEVDGNIKRKNKLVLLESDLIKCEMDHGEPIYVTVKIEGKSIMVLQSNPIGNMKIRKWCWRTIYLNDFINDNRIIDTYKPVIDKFISLSGWPQSTMELLWSRGGNGPPPCFQTSGTDTR